MDFSYSVCKFNVKIFAFWILDVHFAYMEFSVDLVRINTQMMFKHDLGHLNLDPGLAWMFEENKKSVQTHISRGGHCIVITAGYSIW